MRKLLSRPGLYIAIVSGLVVALILGFSQGFSAFESNDPSHTPPSPDSGYWSNDRTTPAPNSDVALHSQTVVSGKTWAVRSFTNRLGEYCAGEIIPGEGQALGCFPPDDRTGGRPVRVYVGSRQEPGSNLTRWSSIWVWGIAQPEIQSARIVFTNCSIEELKPDAEGVFLYVEDPELVKEDVWPVRVEAIDAVGEVADTAQTPLEAPDTDEAKKAGVEAPPTDKACS
jgi:hypothetical protein